MGGATTRWQRQAVGTAGGPGPPDDHSQCSEAEDHGGKSHQAAKDGDQCQMVRDPSDGDRGVWQA